MVTQIKTPSNSIELEELLLDEKRSAEAFATPEAAKAFIESYRESANKTDPEIQRQLQESQSKAMRDFLAENGYEPTKGSRPPMSASVSKGNPHATGAELNGQFSHFGEFLQKVHHREIFGGRVDSRLKDLGESAGDQGGFLVPEEFRAELLSNTIEAAIVRPRARVIPMARQTMSIPSIRDTSHASTVFGGITAQWINEAGNLSSSTNEPTFAQVRLDAKKLTGYTVVSNELLNDSAFALEALLTGLFRDAISYFEDDAFINGSGAGQPLGVLNADALVTVAKETGQAATTIVWENIVKMFSRMMPQSLGRAVWIAHQDTIPELATMSLNVGTGGSAVWGANGVGALPATLLGRPIIYSEKAHTLGTAGDIYFVDLGQYLIGDRQVLTIDSSPHVKFINDQSVFRFVSRLDGRPWLDSALTPRNGSNTLSPFVNLATRS